MLTFFQKQSQTFRAKKNSLKESCFKWYSDMEVIIEEPDKSQLLIRSDLWVVTNTGEDPGMIKFLKLSGMTNNGDCQLSKQGNPSYSTDMLTFKGTVAPGHFKTDLHYVGISIRKITLCAPAGYLSNHLPFTLVTHYLSPLCHGLQLAVEISVTSISWSHLSNSTETHLHYLPTILLFSFLKIWPSFYL